MALERLQVNVEGDLLRQVDAYADSLHITRTAAVSVLLSRASVNLERRVGIP